MKFPVPLHPVKTLTDMTIALFGKHVSDPVLPFIQQIIDSLHTLGVKAMLYRPFFESLGGKVKFHSDPLLFDNQYDLQQNAGFFFSVGGDGTILDAVNLVGDSGIPVTGINLGRLGFLPGISKENIVTAFSDILEGRYRTEQRALLQLDSPEGLFGRQNVALNDLTVSKPDVMSLITIRTWINGEFLNAYWADGLIIATPTGSTAYSMSCTGPIMTPDSESFVITPIASHNLTVRPIIIRDDSEIRLRIEGQNSGFHVSLDSRTVKVENGAELLIRKAPFRINMLRLNDKNFFQTLREKLNWGLDNRN